MLSFFATNITDPLSVLSSGNTALILAFIIVVLAGVIIYQQKQINDANNESRQGYKDRISDNKQNALDYKEMAKDNGDVLLGNSQNMALLSEKIEVVKGRRG